MMDLGRMITLPSSFVGSDRYMAGRVMLRAEGADLFKTLTCNPKWHEITDELLAGRLPADRYTTWCRESFTSNKSA